MIKRPLFEQEALQELLRSDVWRLVKARLSEQAQSLAQTLVYGRTLSIEEVRLKQGEIGVLRRLIEEADVLLDTRVKEESGTHD